VAGRCFIKQDHQGSEPGTAHDGIVAAALAEAMALACGREARAHALTVEFADHAPVGAFLELEARIEDRTDERCTVTASARAQEQLVARARGIYG
jgi:acyl-coenzyme A thioesterase PaaI-like protein